MLPTLCHTTKRSAAAPGGEVRRAAAPSSAASSSLYAMSAATTTQSASYRSADAMQRNSSAGSASFALNTFSRSSINSSATR